VLRKVSNKAKWTSELADTRFHTLMSYMSEMLYNVSSNIFGVVAQCLDLAHLLDNFILLSFFAISSSSLSFLRSLRSWLPYSEFSSTQSSVLLPCKLPHGAGPLQH
jgi:hypothetical protein